VGPNGSGKSTLARLADGLLHPTEGRVSVDDMDTSDAAHVWDVRSRVGIVFQDPDVQIVGTRVEDDVAFGPENLGVPPAEIRLKVDEALGAVGLQGLGMREPHLLSEGQKQRLSIAGALALDPAYLVLDEPTALLDPVGRAEVLAVIEGLVREAGHGVLLITHRMAEVAIADRVVALSEGRLVHDGEPGDLLADERLVDLSGLSLPAVARVAERLRRAGVEVPATAMTADALAEALWA
jgi:energy-coupling factor transport system ATP-binding protein